MPLMFKKIFSRFCLRSGWGQLKFNNSPSFWLFIIVALCNSVSFCVLHGLYTFCHIKVWALWWIILLILEKCWFFRITHQYIWVFEIAWETTDRSQGIRLVRTIDTCHVNKLKHWLIICRFIVSGSTKTPGNLFKLVLKNYMRISVLFEVFVVINFKKARKKIRSWRSPPWVTSSMEWNCKICQNLFLF